MDTIKSMVAVTLLVARGLHCVELRADEEIEKLNQALPNLEINR